MGRWARHERTALMDALVDVGPDAPTLCGGWTAADLAAHVYVRERRPDAALGVLPLGPLSSYTERVMQSALRTLGFDEIVQRMRSVPPHLRLGPLDEQINTIEYLVHTEDVRRPNGRPDRELPTELEQWVWSRLRRQARLSFRRYDGQLRLVSTSGGEPIEIGKPGEPGQEVEVRGLPSELMLLAFNRQADARVELDGPADAVARLRGTQLGL